MRSAPQASRVEGQSYWSKYEPPAYRLGTRLFNLKLTARSVLSKTKFRIQVAAVWAEYWLKLSHKYAEHYALRLARAFAPFNL